MRFCLTLFSALSHACSNIDFLFNTLPNAGGHMLTTFAIIAGRRQLLDCLDKNNGIPCKHHIAVDQTFTSTARIAGVT